MSLLSRKNKPTDHGLELSRRLKKAVGTIPDAVASIGDQGPFNLEDVDRRRLIRELTILTYVGQRLALQLVVKQGERDAAGRRELCGALDQHASEFLDNSQEFNNLLGETGEQYFHLMQSHKIQMTRQGFEKLFEAVRFKFEQFCRGGGHEEEYIVIGGFSSMGPLQTLATMYWMEGFMNTVEYITEHKI